MLFKNVSIKVLSIRVLEIANFFLVCNNYIFAIKIVLIKFYKNKNGNQFMKTLRELVFNENRNLEYKLS